MLQIPLQMPESVQVEEMDETFGRFVVQPFERGFGLTMGNAFRRVLLSSLGGSAIMAVKIDGVQHEFSTIAGVTEDVSDIILNLKAVRFKAGEEVEEGTISLSIEGPGEWTAKDIEEATADFEILNPDQHIATLAEDGEMKVELRVGQGRGYVPAEDNKRSDDPIGVVSVDSIFSPILNVKYDVTPTRVGQKIDFEKLTIEVTTDGSLTPEDALTYAAAILRDHIGLFVEVETEPEEDEAEKEVDAEVQRLRALFGQPVDDLELSVRAQNCLRAAEIKTIGQLVSREESDMLKFRNFGRKSLMELVDVLEDRGLRFGMDVEKYTEGETA